MGLKSRDKAAVIIGGIVITILAVMFVLVIVSILVLHFKPDSTLAYFIRDGIQMIQKKLDFAG